MLERFVLIPTYSLYRVFESEGLISALENTRNLSLTRKPVHLANLRHAFYERKCPTYFTKGGELDSLARKLIRQVNAGWLI